MTNLRNETPIPHDCKTAGSEFVDRSSAAAF
jgi:hypothetical protein